MEKKIIKGEFDKLKDRLSNLADTYEDKAYDDAINKLYDRLDDLSKEKVKILNTIRKLETQKCVKNIKVGDYIIKGVKGEFYPCKPDIFLATYEKVE